MDDEQHLNTEPNASDAEGGENTGAETTPPTGDDSEGNDEGKDGEGAAASDSANE